jgi:protein-L-isoaspartate O-methyltransferase
MARANCTVALSSRGAAAEGLEILEADASAGLSDRAPFDRIILSAGVARPGFREGLLLAQLGDDGILLYPEARGRLYRVQRQGEDIVRESWEGVEFVRLKGRNS